MKGQGRKTPTRVGWGWPKSSGKAHYFVDGASLCGEIQDYRGKTERQNDESVDNCVLCKKHLATLRA